MTNDAKECSPYLAESVKNIIEENQDLSLGNLGNIVHTLAGVISDPRILIGETCKDGRDYFFQISRYLLLFQYQTLFVLADEIAYRAQGYRSCSQTY